MPIDVLLEHADFFIVNKPAGIAVQNEQDQQGFIHLACQQLQQNQLWLVHRLDKITSGVLILARSSEAAAQFGQLFEQRKISKYYLALADKKPKKKQGTIKGGMRKARDGQWMLSTQTENVAHSQFFSFGVAPNIRLFLIKPLTGKTHQIRVALKSIGSPILGDTLYKGRNADRAYLHAYGVCFRYQQQVFEVFCPPVQGEYFNQAEVKHYIATMPGAATLAWPKVAKPN